MAACSRGAAVSRVASAASRTRSIRACAMRSCSWNPPPSGPVWASGLVAGIIDRRVSAELFQAGAPGPLREDLHPLLRRLQGGLALARQLDAALKAAQGLIQRQVAGLHAGDQRLEFRDRGLKAGFLGVRH